MHTYTKAGIAIAVIIIAAIIVIPKLSQPAEVKTGSKDSSSLAMIQKTIKNGKPTLLLLRTSNWPSCVTVGQLVDEIKPSYEGKVNVLTIFVDEEKEQPVAAEFNVQYVPLTLVFDKNGTPKESFVNVFAKEKMTSLLDSLVE